MAKKRDVIIGVIIVGSFLIAFAVFALMLVGMFNAGDGIDFAGLGGDVGVIELAGVISEPMSRPIIKQIDKWAKSGSIKAIVVHINSPGGAVAPSQEIYDAINRAKEEKPVVASMASVAASGGFYVACAADRVVANPGTLTGSIGVILQFYTAGALMKKIGLSQETVKSGELKDVGNMSRDMSEEEELMLRAVIMDTYEQFVQAVAVGRSKDKEVIYPLADGSIFTGLQAYNLGLVDTLGGLHEAINVAADLAGISGEPQVVRPLERRDVSIWDVLGGLAKKLDNTVENELSGPQLMFLYK
jgi:protease-4